MFFDLEKEQRQLEALGVQGVTKALGSGLGTLKGKGIKADRSKAEYW
jgi:hypothetical protein